MPSSSKPGPYIEEIFHDPRRLVDDAGAKQSVPEGATFRLQLNSFRLLEKETPRWPGRKLRFTITWRVDMPPVNPQLGDGVREMGMDIEGCMARVNAYGELIWSPPQSRSGNYYANFLFVTPYFYGLIKKGLTESKYYEILKPLNVRDLDPMKALKKIDPQVPEVIPL
jgi:hypothetical protein